MSINMDDINFNIFGNENERVLYRYSNRKLYDTGTAGYVNCSFVEKLVQEGFKVKILSHPSKEDVTMKILRGIAQRYVSHCRETIEAMIKTRHDLSRVQF